MNDKKCIYYHQIINIKANIINKNKLLHNQLSLQFCKIKKIKSIKFLKFVKKKFYNYFLLIIYLLLSSI